MHHGVVTATPDALGQLFQLIDLTGVLANAVLGGIVAREHRLDPVGLAALAILSGLGGGLLRDALLQAGPPAALTRPSYIVTALAGAVLAFVLPVPDRVWHRAFAPVDALALGAWAATGAQKALLVGLGALAAVLLGTITAVGGGMVRDVVLRRIPAVFGGNTLYATSAVAASAVMVLGSRAGSDAGGLVASLLVGAGLTLLARRRGWRLPPAPPRGRS